MASFWLSFRDCGWTSFVIVLLTIVALMDAVAAAVVVFGSKSRQLGIILSAMTLCLGVGIVGVGEVGQISGRARTAPRATARRRSACRLASAAAYCRLFSGWPCFPSRS